MTMTLKLGKIAEASLLQFD